MSATMARGSLNAPAGERLKRCFDLAATLAALVFLSPLLLLLAALLKMSDNGPLFYGHKRVGRFGNEFICWKFRTMKVDGDAALAAHFARHPESLAEWRATRKLQRDPRVTRVGHVLRKLSLDELPQLLNILKGEMSLVGPRPVVADELTYYGPHTDCYLGVRPGLTGLWQVSGRSNLSYADRVAFDRKYAANRSFALDLQIIVRTIPAVCAARGSV